MSILQKKHNVLLEYDIDTKNVNILYGVDIISLAECHDEVFSRLLVVCKHNEKQIVTVLEKNGTFLDNATKKYYISSKSDLELPQVKKEIKEVYITTKEDITLTVFVDNRKREYKIKGKNIVQRLRVGMSGYCIQYSIESTTKNPHITPPTFIVRY